MKSSPNITLKFTFDKYMWLLALILILSAFLRFPPSNWITGGQDQGGYVNMGNYIQRTGKIFIHDKILEEIKYTDRMKDYYLKNTYNYTKKVVPDRYEGAYLPGIYVKNLKEGILVPQFYHLHPIWLAIFNSILGIELSTFYLLFFSLISIILIYLLTGFFLCNRGAGLISASILALNPLHSYMSKFPVTEVMAGMFFLSGLYYLFRLLDSDDSDIFSSLMTILSFGCFFFTRLTGFLFLPLFLFLFFYISLFEKNRNQRYIFTISFIGILIFYVYCFVHGYIFSFPYVYDVFNTSLHINILSYHNVLLISLFVVLMMITLFLARKFNIQFKVIKVWLARYRKYVISGLIGLVILLIVYKGYLFAFTDKFSNPRWNSPGTGFDALIKLNISVLAIMLTPVGLLLSFFGIYKILMKWFYCKKHLVIGLFSLYFLAVYTIAKTYTPYLYYYGRYLLSELTPLLIVCLSFCLFHIKRKNSNIFTLLLVLILVPSFGLSYLHTRDTEMKYIYNNLKDIDSLFDNNSIIFIDKEIEPDYRYFTAPLKLTFNKNFFIFDRRDLVDGKLENIFRHFFSKNYNLFLMSNKDDLDTKYFSFNRKMPITLNQMLIRRWTVPVDFSIQENRFVSVYRQKPEIRNLVERSFGVQKLRKSGFAYSMRISNNYTLDDTVFKKEKTVTIPVLLKNRSKQKWSYRGKYPINLSYHWLDGSGAVIIYDGIRSHLPYDIRPNDEVLILANVAAPKRAGKYILEFDMVQEDVSWFKKQGVKTLILPVTVH